MSPAAVLISIAGTVDLSSTDSQIVGLPASYTFTAADVGSHTFNGVMLETVGNQTITATDSVNSSITGTSTKVNVKPAAATQLVITRRPGGVIAGVEFGLTVAAEDPYSNVDTSYNGQVTVSLGSGSSGTLTGTLMMNATAGVATFTDLVDTSSGSISLNANSTGLTGSHRDGIRQPGACRPVRGDHKLRDSGRRRDRGDGHGHGRGRLRQPREGWSRCVPGHREPDEHGQPSGRLAAELHVHRRRRRLAYLRRRGSENGGEPDDHRDRLCE